MEGVGPGSVLAGRYTVGALVRQSAGAQRWTAREPVLGRSVSLLILPSGDSRAAAVLDAARMAAGLDAVEGDQRKDHSAADPREHLRER